MWEQLKLGHGELKKVLDVLPHVAFNANNILGKVHKERVTAPSCNDFRYSISILATRFKHIIKHDPFLQLKGSRSGLV